MSAADPALDGIDGIDTIRADELVAGVWLALHGRVLDTRRDGRTVVVVVEGPEWLSFGAATRVDVLR